MDRKKVKKIIGVIFSMVSIIFTLSGCNSQRDNSDESADQIVSITYFGTIAESPLYVAVENGLFDEEGVKVELVKSDIIKVKDEIDCGIVDGVTTGSQFFKYVEEGLPLSMTASLQAGSIRFIVPKGSTVATVSDLKKLRIGVQEAGDGSMAFATMFLRKNGIDANKEVEWKYFGEEGFEKAFEKGDIDVACIWEPSEIREAFVDAAYRTIYKTYEKSNAGGCDNSDGSHFTRSFVGLSTKIVKEQPEKAAAITRAWIKAANWVAENQEETARLAVEKGYVSGTFEENYDVLSSYMWIPSVKTAKQYIKYYISEQKASGLLSDTLNEKKFYKNIFSQVLPDF